MIRGEINLTDQYIGKRIQQARVSKHMTQKDLSVAVGKSREIISKIEAGSQSLPAPLFINICSLLDLYISSIPTVDVMKEVVSNRAKRVKCQCCGIAHINDMRR